MRRARMAHRLARWLHRGQVTTPGTVADGVLGHIDQWGWVDRALAHVWLGDDTHQGLAAAYRVVYERVRDQRRDLDRGFATRLAAWTAAGTGGGELLTVETVLPRVVAPAAHDRGRPTLLIVLDGLSAADAVELGEELAEENWVEYDPLAGTVAGGARRRGVVAALPTMTGICRTSLLAATLRRGDQDDERRAFESHPLWRGRRARLFHKGSVHGGAGEVLGEDLTAALADPDTLVGVVINTVDDALHHGRESADAGWRINQLGPLRALLKQASYYGRAVIITSDHGHVLERDGVRQRVDGAQTRYRIDPAPAGEGEIELSGPRVVAEQQRIVALWDAGLRYSARFAGDTLFDVSAEPAAPLPADAGPSLVEALLAAEMFAAQHALNPRKLAIEKVRDAITALLDAGGILPAVIVADRAGEQPARAAGFITMLQRIFNVDNYQVLALTDNGRTVRLDVTLLREQFGLRDGPR